MNKLRRAIGGFICAWKGRHGDCNDVTMSVYVKRDGEEDWRHESETAPRVLCSRCGLLTHPISFNLMGSGAISEPHVAEADHDHDTD